MCLCPQEACNVVNVDKTNLFKTQGKIRDNIKLHLNYAAQVTNAIKYKEKKRLLQATVVRQENRHKLELEG